MARANLLGNLAPASAEPEEPSWTPPVVLEPTCPPFPTGVLTPWLKDYVEALATAAQVPEDLPATLTLATVATACAKKVEVRVNAGYSEPVNLYTVVALAPGNRKSSVFSKVTAPLRDWEAEELRRLEPIIRGAENQKAILEAQLAQLRREAGRMEGPEQRMLIAQANTLSDQIAQVFVPAMPRLVADDITPEKVPALMQDNQGRIALMAAEGGIFEIMGGKYSAKSAPNFDVFLKGHSGDDIRVDRVSRMSEFVRRPALTMGLAVQPDVIRGLADKPGFRGRGLLGRLLFSMPKSLVGSRQTNAPAMSDAVGLAYSTSVRALLALPLVADDSQPKFLRLSEEARDELTAYATALEPQLAEGGDLGSIADWGGKLVGAVTRLAGLLHMADTVSSLTPWDIAITGDTMRRAIAIGNYLVPHAKAAFGLMSAVPEVEDAKFVLRWIQRNGEAIFTPREAFTGTRSRFLKMQPLKEALDLLEELGYIRLLVNEERGRGRPSPSYAVNPLAN